MVSSFVGRPVTFTPVCSNQWPGYNIAKPLFETQNTILLGISIWPDLGMTIREIEKPSQ